MIVLFFFFKQKTAYEMRISDWSSDVCSSDLNRLDFALAELGRIERTLFTLDWLEQPELRRACQAGLNKGEARHTLAAAIYTNRQGRFTDRSLENQEFRASGLNLPVGIDGGGKRVDRKRQRLNSSH